MLGGSSCKKTRIQNVGGTLKFSVDTLKFDTVFTAAGSFTTGLLIYNPQNEDVILSSVKLHRGDTSYFHLNVDGFPGNSVTNLKIAAHDSLYVFATVTIDPNNKLTPFVVTDSLVATLNGQQFYVPFTAYGQNAHYIVDSILTGNVTWTDALPYVIINSAEVYTGSTLTINPGARIYMHQNSALIVLGKLVVNGTPTDTVVFQGDRLDRAYFGYQGYPGEWGGIYFGSYSNGSKLSYTRLEDCGNGALSNLPAAVILYPDSTQGSSYYTAGAFSASATPQLSMDHCIIENSYGYGIYSWQGSLVATNCLVNTTGQQALAIIQGGYDSITNCTFANYGNYAVSHATSGTVAILDYYWDGVTGDPTIYGGLSGVMRNCIVYGSLDSEIVCDATGTTSPYTANMTLDHCLLKIGNARPSFVNFTGYIFNQDPLFKNTTNADFHLSAGSPAISAGNPTIYPSDDLEGNPRTGSDIGCYQH